MYLLGFSLDNLSLMALTISTGFVVDDAIVMIENIDRYLEAGDSPLDAALKGSGQIGFTIISLTVSLIAVLIPLLFMGDIVGRLFREFAVTLSVTILISAVVSLTLTPMMCSKLLRHQDPGQPGSVLSSFRATVGSVGDRPLRRQPASRAAASDRPRLLVTLGTLGFDVVLVCRRAQGFFPRAGYRRHPGYLGSSGDRLRFRAWRRGSGNSRA